jgi:DNA-binding transcriptional LysR family regulator
MRDFNDLFFFAAVVKNKGFSAAARQLGVPKSRISRRVAEFEAQLRRSPDRAIDPQPEHY